jgi:DNA-binding winged helix-turn-helix (wHTH) protein
LFRSGEEIELTAKEFRLLAYFASRPGRALARNDILNAVWRNSVMAESPLPLLFDGCANSARFANIFY